MNYPLQENLEVFTDAAGPQVRCAGCGSRLCAAGENWRSAGKKSRMPPHRAGSLMAELSGQFLLEQICCPSCGALFQTDLIEHKTAVKNSEEG